MFKHTFFALIGLSLTATTAFAADAVSLISETKLDRVVTENGVKKHVITTPKKVLPGDRLIFTTSYRNNTDKAVTNFVVNNPVPKATLVDNDGSGTYESSVDGGKSFGALAKLTVADGKGGRRPAQSSDITHVRWTVASIAPGGAGSVEYKAVVR